MEALNILQKTLLDIYHNSITYLPSIICAIVILILTHYIKKLSIKLLHRYFSKIKLRKALEEIFEMLIGLGITVFGLLIAIAIIFPSFTVSGILATLGLGSVAIGFAFKDIFENFLAGILILSRESFKINDFIECEEFDGVVEEITVRDTHIRKSTGERIVLPNAMLFKKGVTVITDLNERRASLTCGISYDEDIEKTIGLLKQVVEETDTVDKDKGVEICADEFADSCINYKILWWTKSKPKEIRHSKSLVMSAIHKELTKNNIEIPFPHRDILIKNNEITTKIAKSD